MKVFVQLMLISMLMILAAPAWAGAALHTVQCQQDAEITDEQVEAISVEWLKAARTVKGGENLDLYLNFPVAAKVSEVDVALIIFAPSFAEWGLFMDNYADSAVEAVEEKYQDGLDCGNGTLWESLKIE